MKLINSTAHGLLDYATVTFFLVAPTLFTLSTTATLLCYLLGVVHLLLTLLTNFGPAAKRIIPFKIHGYVELIVSIVLVATPWFFGSTLTFMDALFFTIVGVIIFGVWFFTEYKHKHTGKTA